MLVYRRVSEVHQFNTRLRARGRSASEQFPGRSIAARRHRGVPLEGRESDEETGRKMPAVFA
jgi:hypothetical protein